jgi:trehalose 6-phosphate synthase
MAVSPLPSRDDQARDDQESEPGLSELLAGRHLYVASNRGPVHYRLRDGRPEPTPAAGGMVQALMGLAGYAPVTWIATATGPADRQVAGRPSDKAAAPGKPRLRFVAPSDEQFEWFYSRFANPVLWFLQHSMWDLLDRPDLPEMIERGWKEGYRPVNEAFAEMVVQEVAGLREPIVLVQDYHLYLVPRLLRQRIPGARLQHFTHIPWPSPGHWQPLPPDIRRAIFEGLLGTDIAGFQTDGAALNFMRCCERFVPGAEVNYERGAIQFEGRTTRATAYPISIDPDRIRESANSPNTQRAKEKLMPLLGEKTIVRVDRLDPSKNIIVGFRAFGALLERRPDLHGRIRFLAFLVPSRESIPEYARYAEEVMAAAKEVNDRFGGQDWQPIQVFHEDNRSQSMAGMSLADVMLVNPRADGMNLVAKEALFLSERSFVLVLSKAAGAHKQLAHAAISVPPLDVEATAAALERALDMPLKERRGRIATLRAAVRTEDLSWWVRTLLEDLVSEE